MNLIIQETGEMKEVHFMGENGYDIADEIAASCGFDSSQFAYDDDNFAYVVPKEEADYWMDFFEIYNSCEGKLHGLKNRYDAEEVSRILESEMPEFDIDVYEDAVESTTSILRRRYDTRTARLVFSYDSDLEQNDSHYFKESLYQRADGSYFLAGEGGAMTKYANEDERGGRGYGEGSYSISEAQAQTWIAKYCNKETKVS